MSNGSYYYPTNTPAPKNTGGLNAFQLSVQKVIQQNNASWKKSQRNCEKYAATQSNEQWSKRIDRYY